FNILYNTSLWISIDDYQNLLPDAKLRKNAIQQILVADGPRNLTQVMQGMPDLESKQFAADGLIQHLQGIFQGLVGAAERLDVADVGNNHFIAVQTGKLSHFQQFIGEQIHVLMLAGGD